MDLGLEGKVALVAASSKGLGKACAIGLAAEGAHVVMCARNRAELERAADEARQQASGKVIAVPCDVSRADDIAALFAQAREQCGEIDVLVINAGGPPPVPLDELTDEHWLAAFELTHLSAVRMVRHVLPAMRRRKWGRILAIESSSVKQPVAGLHLSNGIRPGVAGFFKSIIADLAKDSITINMVLPGMFLTNRIIDNQTAAAQRMGTTLEARLDALRQTIPSGRFGEPRELADMIVFLASERAAYITGTAVQVDGGLIRSVV
jgi:3-oxoacyl-[acyl-carrier protein] reductase